jgi:ABC-2 type transport system ATP-binding protein
MTNDIVQREESEMDTAVKATELRKTYAGGVTALDGLSITVAPGTVFGLLGPNGAGKSTTVRILSTLTRPDSGSAVVAGVDVLGDPLGVRRAIGVVGQKHGFDPEATGRENLVLQGEFHSITGSALRERVEASLRRFGLADAATRKAKTYSGGMQRRLDVAMGLIHRPSVLFLDEPTTGLDPEARADMWQEIERLRDEQRMTILLTTHYLEEADRLAAEVAIVDHGRIVVQGAPGRLKSDLEGDTLEVELAADGNARLDGALSEVEGIDLVTHERGTLRARARDGAASIPAVLAALEARGLTARSVTVARPSLDEVYLRHVGRSFEGVAP